MEQKSILEFLKSDAPFARCYRRGRSRTSNGMVTFYAFRIRNKHSWN